MIIKYLPEQHYCINLLRESAATTLTGIRLDRRMSRCAAKSRPVQNHEAAQILERRL